MDEHDIGIGLIGCGTVGTGVARLLAEHGDLYAARAGRRPVLRQVLVRDVNKQRDVEFDDGVLTDDADAFFHDESIDIVVEVAGGIEQAGPLVERAINNGRHVVTANKSLLAAHGPELFDLARKQGVCIGFEASCAGGVPIVNALQFALTANRIEGLYGILNGTCNYILTEMTARGTSYESVLADAQRLGYAEADPTADVGGHDAAQKLAILASLAFGVKAEEADVSCEGITRVDLADIRTGEEMGYQLKLLAIGERVNGGLSLRVHPCFVHDDTPIAAVKGPFNAVSVLGDAVGETLYYGRGAGEKPTASAVVADILSIAAGWYPQAFESMGCWPDQQERPELVDPAALKARYYLRFQALDRPGTIGQIATVLGEHSIGIAAFNQHEVAAGNFVPLVAITHNAREGDVRAALEKIGQTDVIDGEPACLRIVDLPEG